MGAITGVEGSGGQGVGGGGGGGLVKVENAGE